MVICLERGADLHTAQLMPLPLTLSCFSKIQIGFTFLVPAHLGSPGQRAVKQVCMCVLLYLTILNYLSSHLHFKCLYVLFLFPAFRRNMSYQDMIMDVDCFRMQRIGQVKQSVILSTNLHLCVMTAVVQT